MNNNYIMKVKMFLCATLALVMGGTAIFAQSAKTPTNRYSMKLKDNGDGTYELLNAKRYAKIVDLSKIEDLTVPFVLERKQLKTADYKGVETREFVYSTHEGYELQIKVDMAVSENPAPVMFYCHGGGWARGTNDSPRMISQYLAKQKGIAGVRIQYSLAPQEGASVEVSVADINAAVEYIRRHAAELNIDASRMGFWGNSAGAHLAACGAMMNREAKVYVGNSGIYDLTTAAITTRAKDPQRIEYFGGLDEKVLAANSPVNMISKKHKIAALLFCGTADITVEYSQSREFAAALEKVKGNVVDLQVYENYDHNLNSNSSDKMEEIFFKTVDFVSANL